MKRIWIKLYVDMLDDPRMGRLPGDTWRRAVEMFLVAGETGDSNDGNLPAVEDMAWRLRTTAEELNETLRVLSLAGIVHRDAHGVWVVSDFANQQEPITSTARVREWRKRADVKQAVQRSNETAAAADEIFHSDSISASSSQGEEVQEEGVASLRDAAQSTELSTSPTPVTRQPARKRHKPVGMTPSEGSARGTQPRAKAAGSPSSAAARAEYELNAGTREAERLLIRVASLAALPPGELARIEQVAALTARYGPEATGRELVAQRERWLKTVSERTGKPYSPLNFGWVDWADAVLGGNPPPGKLPPEEQTPAFDREAYEKLEREAVPPPPEIATELARIRADLTQKAGLT